MSKYDVPIEQYEAGEDAQAARICDCWPCGSVQPVGCPRNGRNCAAAEVGIHSWAGLVWHRCKVIGETPKRYRVVSRDWPRERLVPKHAIRFLPEGDNTP